MSERLYPEDEWPFEPQLIGFNGETLGDLDEHLLTFELSTERFINTFTSAMEGKAGQHFYDAITLSHGTRIEHIQALEELSEYLYDSMDRDTATRVWATIVHDHLTYINGAMIAIDEKAAFTVPDMQELQAKGLSYFEGVDKAFEDGEEFYRVTEAMRDEEEQAFNESLTVQELPELIENEFNDDDIEGLKQIRDEYGQWVIAEYCNNLNEYLDNLLKLCPKDMYPEIS